MNQISNTCNIEIDENNYLKDRTVCKKSYIENRRKNNNKTLIQNRQPKSSNLTKTMTKTLMFQRTKIMPMLLLAPETWVKPITCSKYLKK